MLKHLIAGRITSDKEHKSVGVATCWLCQEVIECYTDVVSDNFTNYEDVSDTVFCSWCSALFNATYRSKSFYITQNEIKTPSQKEFLGILNNLEFPCILSFTDSNKKHRLFRSKISHSPEQVFLMLDNGYVEFNLTIHLPILNSINEFYKNNKVSKEWILTGNYPITTMRKIWTEVIKDIEQIVQPLRGSQLLEYMVRFCNKE